MLAQWLSYPSASDSPTSFRVLFYPAGSTLPTNTSYSYLSQGGASGIGNKSCTHVKVELDIIPLDPKYAPVPFNNKSYQFLRWTCSGMKYARWTSLLDGCGRTRVIREVRTRSIYETFVTVRQATAGAVYVTKESIETFEDPMTTWCDIAEYIFKARPYPATTLDWTCTIRSFSQGKWSTRQIYGTCPGGYVDVAMSSETISAKALWTTRGSEFINNARKHLPLRESGELVDDCMQRGGKAYQTGAIQYLLEMRQLSSLLSPYLRLIRGGMTAKAAANSWLSHYYGTRLTVKDTYAMISGIVRSSGRKIMSYDKLNSRSLGSYESPEGVAYSGYRSLTVYHSVHTNWMADTYRAMRKYGVNPSLSLAWDLVPFSFVVDWVAPIGDALAHFDGQTFSQSLKIIESIDTEKFEQSSSAALMGFPGFKGYVRFSYYSRRILPRKMPRPAFKFDPISFSGMKALNGVALVVQRRP